MVQMKVIHAQRIMTSWASRDKAARRIGQSNRTG
jgi:sensor domain CHASE-containing protein